MKNEAHHSILMVAAVMALTLVASAVPALANHEHYLLTPGTWLEAYVQYGH